MLILYGYLTEANNSFFMGGGKSANVSANPQPEWKPGVQSGDRQRRENLLPERTDPETQRVIYAGKYAGCRRNL